jgi:Uma2 family endonuclease
MPALDRARRWTREEVLALPDDGNRYELVDGELFVSPTPRPAHQFAVLALSALLAPYVARHDLGVLMHLPADLDLASGQVVQPDIFVATPEAGRRIRAWEDVGIPRLVVEVLSPRTASFDRVQKRRRYLAAGVPTYWIVDLDARFVEVWTPHTDRPAIIADTLTWRPDPSAPALELDLRSFFAEWSEPAG